MFDTARHAEPLIDVLFRTVDTGLCLLDQNGIVLRANQSWLQSMQLSASEVIGRSLRACAPDHAELVLADTETLPPARPRRDGGVWQDRVTRVQLGADSALLLSTHVVAQSAAEQELRALNAAIEQLPIGVTIIEATDQGEFRSLAYNAAHREILGVGAGDNSILSRPRHALYRADRVTALELADWPGPRAAVSGKVVGGTVVHAQRPDGEWRVLEACAAPVVSHGGMRRAVVVTVDETARFNAQRALQERERVYRAAIANIRDTVALLDAFRDASGAVIDWTFFDANAAIAALFGCGLAELIGRRLSEVVKDRAAVLLPAYQRVLDSGEPWSYEARVAGRDFLVKVFRIDDDKLGSVAVDVSRSKAAEAELRRSEAQLRVLVEHTPAGVALLDRELRYLTVSKRFITDFGLEGQSLLGRTHYELFPDLPARWRDVHQRCLAGAVERCDADEFVRADGASDWLEWEVQPWRDAQGTIGGIVIFSVMVTERKHAADKLLAAKERLAVTLSSIGDAVIATDETNRVTLLNAVAEQLTGWSSLEAMGRPLSEVFDIVNEDTGEVVASPADRALKEGIVVGLANHTELIARDGLHRPIADSAAPIRDAHGRISGVVLVFRDQSEQRRAELALQRSRAELFTLVEKLPIGVFVSAGQTIVYANPTFAKYSGYTARELNGRRPQDLAGPASDGAENAPRDGQEWVVRGAAGHPVTLECASAGALEFDGKPAQLWTCRDLTQMKSMQAQLLQSDRQATVGMLAAGVAHEINNPLTYLITALDVIEEHLPKGGSEALEPLREAREGALRVKAIVRDLKSFSRNDDDECTTVDLRPLLDSAISMARNEMRHRAHLVCEYGPAPAVDGSSARLGQVFLNLLVNAAHAVAPGRSDENEIRVTLSTNAQGDAVVEVSDTGSGIPDNVAERLFEPFFTTKTGLGTGLGLAISRNTVTALGGQITLENRASSGAVARVTLPARRQSQETAANTAPSEPCAAAGRARVLIVDDEQAICRMLQRLLQGEHEVAVESQAQQAWARLERGERFDIIFCDVMMPKMSGMDLYKRVLERNAEQAARIVFMTGGTFTADAADFLGRIANVRIDKPFDAPKLRAIVSRALG